MNWPVITGHPLVRGLLPPSRYRHLRDVIGLIAGAGLLAVALAVVSVARWAAFRLLQRNDLV